ncbi:hypothetical protein U1Q18_031367 [Sarracenia purpurea var. burkii]
MIDSSIVLHILNLGKQPGGSTTKLVLRKNVIMRTEPLDLYVKLSSIEEAQKALKDTYEPSVILELKKDFDKAQT